MGSPDSPRQLRRCPPLRAVQGLFRRTACHVGGSPEGPRRTRRARARALPERAAALRVPVVSEGNRPLGGNTAAARLGAGVDAPWRRPAAVTAQVVRSSNESGADLLAVRTTSHVREY